MIEPWKPRGPQDKKPTGAALLVLATEEHRDAMLVTMFMLPPPPFHDHRRTLATMFRTVNLRGGYGIILPIGQTQTNHGTVIFRDMLLPWARRFHTEQGKPYAWRITKNYLGGHNTEAGRSPDNRGQNLKEVLKRSFPDLIDGTYKEKGVTYA
jgi:hypothetical protein